MMILPFDLRMIPMALAVSVSSNLDNIAIGTSLGFRRIALRLRDNAVVATITSIGTVLSAGAGTALTAIVPDYAESTIGGAIMLLVGIWIIYQERAKSRAGASAPVDSVEASGVGGRINASELLMLSLGLTLNNIPNGVGAGMLHINIWLLGGLNFVASLLTLGLGMHVGRRGMHWLGRYAGYIAGALLAALGVTEMVF